MTNKHINYFIVPRVRIHFCPDSNIFGELSQRQSRKRHRILAIATLVEVPADIEAQPDTILRYRNFLNTTEASLIISVFTMPTKQRPQVHLNGKQSCFATKKVLKFVRFSAESLSPLSDIPYKGINHYLVD